MSVKRVVPDLGGGSRTFRLPRRQPGERQSLGEHALTGPFIAPFAKPFGPDAQTPTAMILTDWPTDPLTATTDDPTAAGHPSQASSWVHAPRVDRLAPAATRLLGRLSL